MRIVFWGSPAFAVFPLDALVAAGFAVVGVITQPDRPAGRQRQLTPPPVKVAAERLGLPVLQPTTLRDPAVVAAIAALHPDLGIIAAYGGILRKKVMAIPPLGYLNIHPSLLPLHRGPAPVSTAILLGDPDTGVSVMRLDPGPIDSGPILSQRRIPLAPDARTGPLTDMLFHLGAELLLEALSPYAAGTLIPQPQDHQQATYSQLLQKEDGVIDWQRSALAIERQIRAYDPWPGTSTLWHGQPLKLLAAAPQATWTGNAPPGTLVARKPVPLVMTGEGVLALQLVQPAGRRPMAASDWVRGLPAERQGERMGV